MSNYSKLCSPLPKSLTQRITICENNEQHLVNFLQNLLPPSDCKSIPDELRKVFIFNKFKAKHKQKINHKGKFLFSRKRVHFGLNKINYKNDIKYLDLLPLNQLWLKYMREMLGIVSFADIPKNPNETNWENTNQQLIKADFHGAKISINKSRCPSLVGLTGIIIQDTKNTFRICGTDNIIRTIPKNVVKINVYLDNGVILKAFGKLLSGRPVERSVKKLKNTRIVQL